MLDKALVVLALASALQFTSAKFYTDCGSKLGALDSVKVSGCAEDADECILHRNSNVTFEIEFTTTSAIESVNTVVHGIIMNLPVPFPLPQPDACKNSGLQCPLKASEKYNYHASMPVLKSYPKVSVEVKWELQDENDEDIVCIMIPASIK